MSTTIISHNVQGRYCGGSVAAGLGNRMRMGAVLVTDDEADIRIMLRTVLRARGWSVEEAETGEEAIERCSHGGLDIVVLDHRMPGLTGAETAKRLRELGFTEPIVLYTAYLTSEVEQE